MNEERERLKLNSSKEIPLEKWGSYLSERQWGTVREDYSPDGMPWDYFTHDQARSRVYRWGEDGIAGFSDMHQNFCFALAMWNGKDEILKERLFGLSNEEGNHGEDVKELYYYLDNTPTHSYLKYLYKYPQQAYPYRELVDVNRYRSRYESEYELIDTNIFNTNRYFDITVIYAKNHSEDICISIEIINRGDEEAAIVLLPTLWFRNRWQFGEMLQKPSLEILQSMDGVHSVKANHEKLGTYFLYYEVPNETLMTENETNTERLFNSLNQSEFVKDSFHEAIVQGNQALRERLNNKKQGTKFSPVYKLSIKPAESRSIKLRLSSDMQTDPFGETYAKTLAARKQEADRFYEELVPPSVSADIKNIYRQAFAGLLWSKQFYQYDVERWLEGDPGNFPPPAERKLGRNNAWEHVKISDVLAMPDKWEYPWFAAWDLCFHCIPMAMVDPTFAKNQLILLCREWYMSPQGQIPAYEWKFSDVNPPVEAWAALQVYKTERDYCGFADISFLKRIFQKLCLNFTWWANREDDNENNVFRGGFLGLDNIGVLDRSNLPAGASLEQADATAWMGMFALNLMEMALEICKYDKTYEDVATKFYEHFLIIAESLNQTLWDQDDNFFYDCLHTGIEKIPMKVRSIVGLTALFNVAIIKNDDIKDLPDFVKRMNYIKNYRLSRSRFLPCEQVRENGDILLTLVHHDRLQKMLEKLMDENEFLSPGGIRSLSRIHRDHPFELSFDHSFYSITYEPAESRTKVFGGNSNWRGPVWLPINFLLIQSLHTYHEFYQDSFSLRVPNGNCYENCKAVADELSKRVISMFTLKEDDSRQIMLRDSWFYRRDENRDLVLFYEYFNGDNGIGLGASHQTGWSSLVINLMSQYYSTNHR